MSVDTQPVPLHDSLDKVYTQKSLLAQGTRWDDLATAFESRFGSKPQFVARAPGRVNAIGDHIDYVGFSCMPAAIERDVLMAFSTSGDLAKAGQAQQTIVSIENLDSQYTPAKFEVDLNGDGSDLTVPKKKHWSSYFLVGMKGLLARMAAKSSSNSTFQPPASVNVLVTGSVPAGSGLSSSAAMTCASAACMLQVCQRRTGPNSLDRTELTEVAIESERLVGVNSGGLDQSASVFSQQLNLLHIEFVPKLKAVPVPIPKTNPPMSFVIAHSLVTSEKHSTARFCYNLRVVEARIGARMLAKHLNIEVPQMQAEPLTYRDIVDLYFGSTPVSHAPASKRDDDVPTHLPPDMATAPALPSSPLGQGGPDQMIHQLKTIYAAASQALGGPGREEGMTWDEVYEALGEDQSQVEEHIIRGSDVEPINGRLQVWRRARHIFTEAIRVYEFRSLLEKANSSLETASSNSVLEDMGRIMNESYVSGRDDCENSCPELDEIMTIARANGALGSRVSGAGWGGASVHLVPEPELPRFMEALKSQYFRKRFPDLNDEELEDSLFATKPESGACLYKVSQ